MEFFVLLRTCVRASAHEIFTNREVQASNMQIRFPVIRLAFTYLRNLINHLSRSPGRPVIARGRLGLRHNTV